LISLNYFDLSLHTAYAQAKELALAQRSVPLLTAGSLQTEQRAGGQARGGISRRGGGGGDR
jgi:hypothetical protein